MWSKDINDQLIFVNFCIFLLQWPTILILNEYKYWKNKKKKKTRKSETSTTKYNCH